MKALIFILTMLFCATFVTGQNTIAKLKYEQAEEAFVKNDFPTTLSKLDEAQKLLGKTNPKLLYLRIMAQKGIINAGRFDYPELESVRKNVQYYLKSYENNEGIEDKYRDVYLFSETLSSYPATKAAWDQQQERKNARLRQLENEKAARRALADKFIEEICVNYKWKPGLTVEEFKKYNPKSMAGFWMKREKWSAPFKRLDEDSIRYKSTSGYSAGSPYMVEGYKGIITSYIYVPTYGKEAEVMKWFNEIRQSIYKYFPKEDLLVDKSQEIGIRSYSTGVKINFQVWYIKNDYWVEMIFN